MGSCSGGNKGGGAAASGGGAVADIKANGKESKTPSALEVAIENSRQFREALIQGKENKASIVEFTGAYGNTQKMFWNGAAFVDRKSALYEKEHKGTYKAKFKAPKDWK